jgi:hypothetical protein
MEELGPAFPPRGSSARVSHQLSGTTFLRAFLAQADGVVQWLVAYHGVCRQFTCVDRIFRASLPDNVRLAVIVSPHGSTSLSAGYFVPAAPHAPVASRARAGRLPLTEQRVLSMQDSCSYDFTSHQLHIRPLLLSPKWKLLEREERAAFGGSLPMITRREFRRPLRPSARRRRLPYFPTSAFAAPRFQSGNGCRFRPLPRTGGS